LTGILARIHELADAGRVRLTVKAVRELELLNLGLDEHDVHLVLQDLEARDFVERIRSEAAHVAEWLYVFQPRVAGVPLYVKLAVRGMCVVVSFHEQEDADEFEDF
jgi:hypothetical protein